MDALVATEHAIHGRWLIVPVLHRSLIPFALGACNRQRICFALFLSGLLLGGLPAAAICLDKDWVELAAPHLLERRVRVALRVFALGTHLVQSAETLVNHLIGLRE